jgi:hypothetical protein
MRSDPGSDTRRQRILANHLEEALDFAVDGSSDDRIGPNVGGLRVGEHGEGIARTERGQERGGPRAVDSRGHHDGLSLEALAPPVSVGGDGANEVLPRVVVHAFEASSIDDSYQGRTQGWMIEQRVELREDRGIVSTAPTEVDRPAQSRGGAPREKGIPRDRGADRSRNVTE